MNKRKFVITFFSNIKTVFRSAYVSSLVSKGREYPYIKIHYVTKKLNKRKKKQPKIFSKTRTPVVDSKYNTGFVPTNNLQQMLPKKSFMDVLVHPRECHRLGPNARLTLSKRVASLQFNIISTAGTTGTKQIKLLCIMVQKSKTKTEVQTAQDMHRKD